VVVVIRVIVEIGRVMVMVRVRFKQCSWRVITSREFQRKRWHDSRKSARYRKWSGTWSGIVSSRQRDYDGEGPYSDQRQGSFFHNS
jgi:hypothetical protein